jgi:hypothetical protein
MFLKFINRPDELDFLEERYRREGFEFFVIYGRRRIGKTELIKNFLRDRPHVYLLCDKKGTDKNALRFKKKISEFLGEPIIATDDWEEIFEYLAARVQDRKMVICLDEFSYLVEKDDAVPSVFQVIADEVLRDKNIMLILCGSSVSMMERVVLSRKSPLYGRKTAHIRLNEMDFSFFSEFFPSNTMEKNIEFYSVLGGVPFYLEKFSDKKSTWENIEEQILNKRGRLYEEVDFLLKEEFREPAVYKSILEAMGSGRTKLVDIANMAGINAHDISKYLRVLMNLEIIKKETPVTRTRTKKSIYLFRDNFFNFWFSFCEDNKSYVEMDEIGEIEELVKSRLPAYYGRKFEELVLKEMLVKIFPFPRRGRWWGYKREGGKRKAIEIDVVALNEKTKEILFGECKWKTRVNAERIVETLAEKARYVEWNNGKREECFAVFAKSFSKRIDAWEGRRVSCFDLKDLEGLVRA